jgi:hypothetical protein
LISLLLQALDPIFLVIDDLRLVRLKLSSGRRTQVDGFKSEVEAVEWIGHQPPAQAIMEGAAWRLPESDRQTLSVGIALTLAPWTISPTGSDSSRPPALPKL